MSFLKGRSEASAFSSSADADQYIPDEVLLDTPHISSFLEVFARLGGLALIAEHLPQLYQESAVPQQQAKNSTQGSSSGAGSSDKGGGGGGGTSASAPFSSNWWKWSSDIGSGMKDWGEFEDYEVSYGNDRNIIASK